MPKRTQYTIEYRQQILAQARMGRSAAAIAREADPTEDTIRRWIGQADLEGGHHADDTAEQRRTKSQLRRENKRLRLERNVLLRALTWFRGGQPLDPRDGFAFVSAHRDLLPVRTMCRMLGSSASGFYAWMKRPPSPRARRDAVLRGMILTSWKNSRRTYGRRRIHADLKAQGEFVSQKRVARLMRELNIRGIRRYRRRAARSQPSATTCSVPDLVNRNFRAARPNELWVADITEVPTGAGSLFVAVVLDVWSRLVVGWAADTHLRTELVEHAFDMAIQRRRPDGVVHHSDRGTQYTSRAFAERCRRTGTRPSMGSVGDPYDNALCESFFATLERELLGRRPFANPDDARIAVSDYVEGFYNPHRRHSALGYCPPDEFEYRYGG